MNAAIHFQEFIFHPDLGELIRRDKTGREHKVRLAPQPCKLLSLLLENAPGIVSQKQIQEALWPDVKVDYERGLHYCIRQIRAALNDNATNPRFIETIPRRGYRWKATLGQTAITPTAKQSALSSWKGFFFVLVIFISVLLYFFIPRLGKQAVFPSNDIAQTRVAIMPFEPNQAQNQFTGNDIAMQLVNKLSNNYKDICQIIGPTTTVAYAPGKLRSLVQDLDLHYIINGRFSQVQDTSRVLAEIIRAEDGAHIWVRYFDTTISTVAIVKQITQGFEECINN